MVWIKNRCRKFYKIQHRHHYQSLREWFESGLYWHLISRTHRWRITNLCRPHPHHPEMLDVMDDPDLGPPRERR